MLRLRLHVMRLLGLSTDHLAVEVVNARVRSEDAAREERLGPHEGAIKRAQAHAVEVHERALKVAGE